MSSPIAFDPLPVPPRTGLTTMPPGLTGQATTLDANFAKVNAYLPGMVHSSMRNSRVTGQASSFVAGGWTAFGEGWWPAIEVVIDPAKVKAIMVSFSSEAQNPLKEPNTFVLGIISYSPVQPGGGLWARAACYAAWSTLSATSWSISPVAGTYRFVPSYFSVASSGPSTYSGDLSVALMG